MLLRTTAIALVMASAVPAAAQSISGFTGSAGILANDNEELTTLQGSGEFKITPQFAVGGSLGLYSGDDLDDITNITARGLYFLAPETAIGVFVALDDLDGAESELVGAEFGYGGPFGNFEAYFGTVESDGLPSGAEETIGGLSLEFNVGTNLFVSLATDAYDVDNDTAGSRISSTSIGARYAFGDGPSVYARYGQTTAEVTIASVTNDDTEEFISVGAQFDFGPTSGAIMSNRSQGAAFGF
ncbi:MAG: hypothetical protein AAGF56_10780 [Pseudomonadota bacterium]